jgi:SAM-dependent methyltransferase
VIKTGIKLSEFAKSIWHGKSARRAFLNLEIARRVALTGLVLDLGSKGNPSYHELLKEFKGVSWLRMDISPAAGIGCCGDLTSLPVKDGIFDAVICFNVLEHVYRYRSALSEIRRVLKPAGLLYGYVPFLCNVHPDPSDYWRFTADCLHKSLSDAGLEPQYLSAHGGVFISCFDLSSFLLHKLPPLRVLVALMAVGLEDLLARAKPSYREKYPVGYFFIARRL